MCILRYTPITRPSASITAALLWYRPGARRSNRGAITTTPARCAARPSASVLGPGTGSARSNQAASCRCRSGRDRDEPTEQTAQPDDDALAVARGGGQGRTPAAPQTILTLHAYAHHVVGRKHEVELGLAVIVDGVHQQGLDTRWLAIVATPRETVRDGGESHDRQLGERKLDRVPLCAGGLQVPQVIDRDGCLSGSGGGDRHPADGL